MSARLVIMSDDFGMTHGVNLGIREAMLKGILTNTNIMVPCPWAPEAAAMVRRDGLKAGIHLTITCEWEHYQWRSITGHPSLMDRRGKMHSSYEDLEKHFDEDAIYREYKEQIRLLRAMGVEPTHIDTHMLPAFSDAPEEQRVVEIVNRVADEEGIIYAYRSDNGKPRYFDSIYQQSEYSFEAFLSYLDGIRSGTHLLVTHCSKISEEQRNICSEDFHAYPWAVDYRWNDMAIILSDRVRSLLEERDISLISIDEL